jgi:hypothetical protein
MSELLQPAPGTAPIGRWLLTVVPVGWGFVAGYGLRSTATTPIPSSLLFTEDILPAGDKLDPYTQAQNKMLAQTYPMAQVAGPAEAKVPGADQAQLLILKHPATGGGDVFQIQTYALSARWIGIVTLTAAPQEITAARSAMNEVVAGLRILPEAAELPPKEASP